MIPLGTQWRTEMAGLVRWLGGMAREMQRARTVMRNPQLDVSTQHRIGR